MGLHHAFVAGVMASAVLGMEQFHLLDWLDAVMLRVVAPTTAQYDQPLPPRSPQLVLIDGQTYADVFGLRSPLDRDPLGLLLTDVLAAKPSTVLIDLQLEPAVGESADRPLDRLLKAAARSTRIVLPLPESRTPALDKVAATWMRDQCRAGVVFGSAQLRSHFGAVIRIDEDAMSMASLARGRTSLGSKDRPAIDGLGEAQNSEKVSTTHGALCELVELTGDLESLWQLMRAAGDQAPTSEPISPSTLRGILKESLNWRMDRSREILKTRQPQTIVVGGAYDDRDTFLTHAKNAPVPGAALFTAAIAGHGLVRTSHIYGWCTDVVIGTVLGFIFVSCWRRIRICANRKGRQLFCLLQGTVRLLATAWLELLLATLLWAFAIGFAFGLMHISGLLIDRGLWLNPGPVVMGIFLHALLLQDKKSHKPTTWIKFTRHAPAWPIQAFIISASLAFMLMHSAHP